MKFAVAYPAKQCVKSLVEFYLFGKDSCGWFYQSAYCSYGWKDIQLRIALVDIERILFTFDADTYKNAKRIALTRIKITL